MIFGAFPSAAKGQSISQGMLWERFLPETIATRKTYTPLTEDWLSSFSVSTATLCGAPLRHFWAKCIATRLSSPVFSLQHCQQCLRLLEVSGVKPFGEPAVDIPKYLLRFLTLPLALPESSEAGGST